MRRGLLILVLLAPALTGCLGGDEGTQGTGQTADGFTIAWADKALPFGEGHDHTDRAHHQGLTTPNFEVLGWDPLNSTYYEGKPAGAYFCGDAKPTADGRRLAVVESRSDVAFALIDVTDPSDPTWLGELVMPATRTYDLAVAPDGQHVVLVTSEVREEPATQAPVPGLDQDHGPPQAAGEITWRSACTGGQPVPVTGAQEEDPAPRPMSILLVDISDPENPAIVEQQPLAGSGHSVYTTRIDDRDWVMVTTTRVAGPVGVPVIPENSISAYQFYQIVDTEAGAHLEHLSTWKRMPDDESNRPFGPRGHDGYLAKHPETGTLTAYLAGGDRVTLLDMSEPRNPTELGRWTVKGPGTPEGEGTLHSIWPLPELWDGTHYTIVGPEHAGHPEDHPSGIVWVLDTTDPGQIEPVAAWTLPYEVDWNGTFQFSNHYLSVVDETLFVSMYHGGIWAIDLAPVREATGFTSLPSIGVFFAERSPPTGVADPQRWAPTFEEVLAMPDGSLVTFDGNSGVYTLAFDATNPAPSPEPWPIQPPG